VLRLSTKPGVKVNNLNKRWDLSEQDKHECMRKCAAFDTWFNLFMYVTCRLARVLMDKFDRTLL